MEPFPCVFAIVWKHYVEEGNPPASQDGLLYYQIDTRVAPLRLLSNIELPEVEPHQLLYESPDLREALRLKWPSGPQADLILALQAAHDDAATHSDFRERIKAYLTEVAELYGIAIP
jgi:hypothetical protein